MWGLVMYGKRFGFHPQPWEATERFNWERLLHSQNGKGFFTLCFSETFNETDESEGWHSEVFVL